ncbi:MAG: hypothetical protein ACXW1D_00840 [Halobacteriota archaeon]
MMALDARLANLPIQITYYGNGLIEFNRYVNFNTIVDNPCEGIQAIISNEDIYVGADTVVEYGVRYEYKEMPELLAWLKEQNL